MSRQPAVAVVHGIRTDGADNIDKLIPALNARGFVTVNVDYPWISACAAALTPRRWNRRRQFRDAMILAGETRNGFDVVAHSRGGLVALRAMELGRKFRVAVFFSPAMNSDFTFPAEGAEYVWVVHCPQDEALRIAGILPLNDFGAMGRIGYRGPPDARVVNVRAPKGFPAHSHYFTPAFLGRWTDWLTERLSDPWKHHQVDRAFYRQHPSAA